MIVENDTTEPLNSFQWFIKKNFWCIMRWNGNCKASVNGQLGEVFKRVEREDRCYKNIRHTAVLYSCSCKHNSENSHSGVTVPISGQLFIITLRVHLRRIWQILIKIWHLCVNWQTVLSFWIKDKKKELPAPKYWNLSFPSRWKMWVEEEQTVGKESSSNGLNISNWSRQFPTARTRISFSVHTSQQEWLSDV